jgi:hypothetical protein
MECDPCDDKALALCDPQVVLCKLQPRCFIAFPKCYSTWEKCLYRGLTGDKKYTNIKTFLEEVKDQALKEGIAEQDITPEIMEDVGKRLYKRKFAYPLLVAQNSTPEK